MTTQTSSRNKKTISLRDIARHFDVNVSTVSRALIRDPGISTERADAICRYAKLNGYRPRPIRTKRTNAIGLIVLTSHENSPDHEHSKRLIYLTERRLSEDNLHVHLYFISRAQQSYQMPPFLLDNRVDGVIIIGYAPQKVFETFRSFGKPIVAYGDLAQRAGCDCVLTDPTRGVTMAIEHLIEMGHRQFGIGVGCIDYPTCQMRLDAALQTLKEAGLSPRPEHVIHGADPSMRGGHDVVMQMFKTGEMPTALFMGNDWMAMGAGHMLAVQGYKVPDHVSIVGYDNLDMAENYLPPLSTIDNRLEEVVEHAVVLLHKRLAGDTSFSKQVAIDAYPIWRQTTASPPRRQKTPPSLI